MTLVETEPITPPSGGSVRVLIVDDHRVLREGLSRALAASGLTVVGEAGSGTDALRLAAETDPDVVLLDVSLPDVDGIAVARRMTTDNPRTRVVMLTMFADRATIRDALNAGAAGYLTKDCAITEIHEVLSATASGAGSSGAETRLGSGPADPSCSLSRREVEVLQLIAEGKSTSAVGRELFISAKTVKNHLANIFDKLDVRDRTQAVLQGLRLGLVHLR